VARSCHKTISPRHGFVVETVPTVNGWDWFSEASSYAAVLDCIYEMTLDLVGANAITTAAAVAQVMVDENWKVLPTHVEAIIKRVEED